MGSLGVLDVPGLIDSLATLNSVVRTFLALLVVGAVAVFGYFGYREYNKSDLELQSAQALLDQRNKELAERDDLIRQNSEKIDALNDQVATQQEQITQQLRQIEQLDTSLRLLKVTHRVAWLTVTEQEIDPDTNRLYTVIEFAEVDDQGNLLDQPREFRIDGDVVYLDNWVVKFDDEYVERSDLERSTSLVLFRRIFGENQRPVDGFSLDQVGSRPKVYGAGSNMSEFEQSIWRDFWNIANDQRRAQELGIRAAHGEAPSIKVQKGKSYKVLLRASDGLSITPDDSPPPSLRKPTT